MLFGLHATRSAAARSTAARRPAALALTVLALAALVLTGCAPAATSGGPSGSDGSSGSGGAIHTASNALGDIVVDGKGMTAYVFDNDVADSGSSSCSGACASQWPAITTTAASPAVEGITGKVGTIALAGGAKQVTINGLPLYTYAGDTAPGDTTGQGFGGIWWVIDASGKKITTPAATDNSGY
ncbi:putative lipoprotein with Yx(FWY)xxD motif [Cryobacterium mesophilum]|uniref:Lipoprotein with Yx(FWY)xxD motif n=1 Tax=Terrimesophilobacter mesophilus TaxID=433647 RepID=A0A4R8VA45_9MICO|nr:hypothetical protein [Terrimesophilobacter mesophilus]MBB5632378.1 putative lipoprotein with Yx(FWY)xxD motif [Terrimesophilobacter mesophilus]TFB79216.1 hypothetical protein E3N84_03585 [Terrimesophilobacter mesophilus]